MINIVSVLILHRYYIFVKVINLTMLYCRFIIINVVYYSRGKKVNISYE